jgi:hypothetical protein
MNIKTLLTLSLLVASFNAQSAVTACPSGWTKSADGSECVLETKTTQTPNQVSNTAKPVCISGFTYSSTSMKCEQINNASTYNSNKTYAYLSALKFGHNPVQLYSPTVNYPNPIYALKTFSWSISGAKPNDTWKAYLPWNGATEGPWSINSSGTASYSNGFIPRPGNYSLTWDFTDPNTTDVTKNITVLDPPASQPFAESVIGGLAHIQISQNQIRPTWCNNTGSECINSPPIPLFKYDNVLYTSSLNGSSVMTGWEMKCFSNGVCANMTGCLQTQNYKIRVCGGDWIDLTNQSYQGSLLSSVYHIETSGGMIRVRNNAFIGALIKYWPY